MSKFFKAAMTLAVGCLGLAVIRTNRRQETFMGRVSDQVKALNDRFNAATNELANDLKNVRDALSSAKDQLAQQNADTADTEEALKTTEATIAKLEALGADVQNPVPTDGQGAPGPNTDSVTGSPAVDPTAGTNIPPGSVDTGGAANG